MYRIFLFFVSIFLSATSLTAQEQQTAKPYLLTLEDVVELAKTQSPQAIQARHSFRASYFSFMDYKATFLPKLTLTTNPTTWDKSIRTVESINRTTGEIEYNEARTNALTSTAGLALAQNIGLTGGNVSLGSDFSRRQNFLEENPDRATQYTTTPIRLTINQPLNGYNRFRWEKQIEPLRYEEAKQNYIVAIENVASRAVTMFFSLATAQMNIKIAQTNLKNSQDLYDISKGRHQLGIIAEDQLLQVQLRYMQSESKLNSSKIDVESRMSSLRSYLGFNENVIIDVLPIYEVPDFKVPYEEALNLALTRNPDIIANSRQILEAERDVAFAKSQSGITLNLDATFGTNKTGYTFKDAYSPRFDDQEGISLRINVPILDWNQTRNRIRNAQSLLEVAETRVQQSETDFKQDIFLQVMSFNMQENQLRIAALTDTIAQKSYEISYQRYMIGKGDITVLNIADTAKDEARVTFMRELSTYWNLYYLIRRLTLFDFQTNKPLEEDFDLIIGE